MQQLLVSTHVHVHVLGKYTLVAYTYCPYNIQFKISTYALLQYVHAPDSAIPSDLFDYDLVVKSDSGKIGSGWGFEIVSTRPDAHH